jgi:hypothetical protein
VTDPPPRIRQSRATAPDAVASQGTDAAMLAPGHLVEAFDWQESAVHAAVRKARAWELRFPQFTVAFVNTDHEDLLGLTTMEWDGFALGIFVRLHHRLHPERTERTCLHEFQHVSDLARGRSDPIDVAEARADVFAARVLGPTLDHTLELLPRWW